MWKRYNHAIESQQYHKGFQPLSEPNGEVSSYAEAWRILGTYIDCTPTDDDDGQGNGDAPLCRRWWIYAAYIDENNAGNGLTEYQYMDPVTGEWIEVCDLGNGSQRCKRMDCHESDTHFTHIGTYKILQEDGDFFDQLFKHQGYCVWDDDQYEFMQQAKDMWPDGCTQAEDIYDSNGNKVYYDLKPLEFGKQTVGLYSDPSCIHSLSDEESNYLWDNVMRGGDGDDHDDDISYLYSNLALWDQAMDMFRVCQPCISYRFPSVRAAYSSKPLFKWWDQRKLENAQADVDDGSPFYCNDAAGYQNVNQCYKFASKTDMQRASFEDLQLAHVQGTILKVNYDAVSLGKVPMDDVRGERKIIVAKSVLGVSIFIFLLAIRHYRKTTYRIKRKYQKYHKEKRSRRRRIKFLDQETLLDETETSLASEDNLSSKKAHHATKASKDAYSRPEEKQVVQTEKSWWPSKDHPHLERDHVADDEPGRREMDQQNETGNYLAGVDVHSSGSDYQMLQDNDGQRPKSDHDLKPTFQDGGGQRAIDRHDEAKEYPVPIDFHGLERDLQVLNDDGRRPAEKDRRSSKKTRDGSTRREKHRLGATERKSNKNISNLERNQLVADRPRDDGRRRKIKSEAHQGEVSTGGSRRVIDHLLYDDEADDHGEKDEREKRWVDHSSPVRVSELVQKFDRPGSPPVTGMVPSHSPGSRRAVASKVPSSPRTKGSPRMQYDSPARSPGMSPSQRSRPVATSRPRPGGARSPSPRRTVASQMSIRLNHPSSPTRSPPSPNRKIARPVSSPQSNARPRSSSTNVHPHSPNARRRMVQPTPTTYSEIPPQSRSQQSPRRRREDPWNPDYGQGYY